MSATDPPVAAHVAGSARASPADPPRADANTSPRRRCYIVDDELGIRNVFYAALGGPDMELRGFGSAQALFDAWRSEHPDLIFLDIALERSDAIDVIRALAARNYRGAVQVMSGRDPALQEHVKRVGEQHGLTMLPPLPKPFRAHHVRAMVQAYFAKLSTQDCRPGMQAPPPPAEPAAAADGLPLAEVLGNDWLRFYYQPKFDLQKRQIAGAELLARCQHPERGILLPDLFIPNADEASMRELTERALRSALEDWTAFAEAGFPIKLALNVSVNDLVKVPIHAIARELRPSDWRWPGLILELTEDQAVRDIAFTHEIATQLRIYDIALALDDFGAGYSHLSRLKELPFAEVKLDRNLVADCGEDVNNRSLCRAAIELAHQFGATVVAEGIEKPSELQALLEMGCDIGQGFVFAHALPLDRLIAMLKDLARKTAHA
ncbi:MAG TPA: EAL domain-containing response regulator [Xanthobacteraceae bacterium]|nr:EAL domain-containing response regulator [Xanthobacteraceae bacterium]